MHKPLFVVSFYDANSHDRYIPSEDDVWEAVKHEYDYISPANKGWTEKTFAAVLNSMFDSVAYDGKMYNIPKEAIRAYLEGMTEKIKQYLAEKPLTGETICRWKNGLRYGIIEEGCHFVIDGSTEYGIDFAARLLCGNKKDEENAFASIKLEAIYDAHC